MNFFNPRSLALVAATAVLTTVSMVQTEAAHAFMIRRATGIPAASDINPSLAAPTVINFDNLSGAVPMTATTIGPGRTGDGLNGRAQIQSITTNANSSNYNSSALQVGQNGTGTVSFTFDDPRGMGYFGFSLVNTLSNATQGTISFFSRGNITPIATFTMAQLLGNTVPTGNTIFGTGNYFSFFVTNNSEIFNEVRFNDLNSGNGTNALLRIDDVAYQAIPTPALLPGLAALGIGAVRKRKAEAEAEA